MYNLDSLEPGNLLDRLNALDAEAKLPKWVRAASGDIVGKNQNGTMQVVALRNREYLTSFQDLELMVEARNAVPKLVKAMYIVLDALESCDENEKTVPAFNAVAELLK